MDSRNFFIIGLVLCVIFTCFMNYSWEVVFKGICYILLINIDSYETNVLRKHLVATVVMLMEFQAETWLIGWECSRIGCWGRQKGIRRRKWEEAWGYFICRHSLIVCLTKCYLGDQFKENEMGMECGTYGGEQKCTQCFGEKNWRKETTWKT